MEEGYVYLQECSSSYERSGRLWVYGVEVEMPVDTALEEVRVGVGFTLDIERTWLGDSDGDESEYRIAGVRVTCGRNDDDMYVASVVTHVTWPETGRVTVAPEWAAGVDSVVAPVALTALRCLTARLLDACPAVA